LMKRPDLDFQQNRVALSPSTAGAPIPAAHSTIELETSYG
jgi:hypothetical protein